MDPDLNSQVLGHGLESSNRDSRYKGLAGQLKPLLIPNTLDDSDDDGREHAGQNAPECDFEQTVSFEGFHLLLIRLSRKECEE